MPGGTRTGIAPPLVAKRDVATGHLRKREFGPAMLKVFGVLARFRRLRGTWLDIFGCSAERRLERALIGAYEARIEGLLARLDARNHATIVEIAALAQSMRGFGHVKERNIAQARQREALLLERLDGAAQVAQ